MKAFIEECYQKLHQKGNEKATLERGRILIASNQGGKRPNTT